TGASEEDGGNSDDGRGVSRDRDRGAERDGGDDRRGGAPRGRPGGNGQEGGPPHRARPGPRPGGPHAGAPDPRGAPGGWGGDGPDGAADRGRQTEAPEIRVDMPVVWEENGAELTGVVTRIDKVKEIVEVAVEGRERPKVVDLDRLRPAPPSERQRERDDRPP